MFAENKIEVTEQADAGKEKIEETDAWELIRQYAEIVVGSGKNIQVFNPAKDDREIILKACLGRSGTLRAPSLKIGNRLIVGFNEDLYNRYVR